MKLNHKLIYSSFLIFVFCVLSFAPSVHAATVGSVGNPLPSNPYFSTTNGGGLFLFISNVFKLIGTIAGIYMIFQLITAGYAYMTSNGDPKAASAAWTQIWQSILGMVIIASAFVLASVIGRFTGINILSPTIYGP